METLENDAYALNISESNLEPNENDIDEIIISKRLDCCTIVLYSFISFIFFCVLLCFIFYFLQMKIRRL